MELRFQASMKLRYNHLLPARRTATETNIRCRRRCLHFAAGIYWCLGGKGKGNAAGLAFVLSRARYVAPRRSSRLAPRELPNNPHRPVAMISWKAYSRGRHGRRSYEEEKGHTDQLNSHDPPELGRPDGRSMAVSHHP
ncbi:hypothetical protein LY76DRAFT_594780 [Colletotrichum caudatum]|nr:hypothetical protein LY76DRAFT_594780 [Colletotrichum caudatum]